MKHFRSRRLIQAVLLPPFRAGAPHIVIFGAVSHGRAVIPQKESEYSQSCFSNQALRISGKGWVDHLLSPSPSQANACLEDEGEGI
jgi:hypothetical protein